MRAAQLARSTFFYHLKRLTLPDPQAELKSQIQQIYDEHKGRYGYRRITVAICHTGSLVNHKRVQRLMQQLGLRSRIRTKKYRSYRGQIGPIADNLLQRRFHADAPNCKWVTDVTEFKVGTDKLYLSPVMDLFNGEIISYQLARRPEFALVGKMVDAAMAKLASDQKPLIHSDQGWQYQMQQYQSQLARRGLVQSMSRKGSCLDNASMESFFGTLKSECFYTDKFDSIEQLEKQVHEYIHYYNHKRIKLKLKGLSPVQYRIQSLNPI